MEDDTDQVSQDDQELLPRQFTTVFEYLTNVSGFELPFILVLLDANDSVVGNTIVQSGENENVLTPCQKRHRTPSKEGCQITAYTEGLGR